MPTEPKVAKTRKRGPHKKALSGGDAEPSKPTKKKRTGNKAGNKRKAADLQIEEPGESEVAKTQKVDHADLRKIQPLIEHLKRKYKKDGIAEIEREEVAEASNQPEQEQNEEAGMEPEGNLKGTEIVPTTSDSDKTESEK